MTTLDATINAALDGLDAELPQSQATKPEPFVAAVPIDLIFADLTYQRPLDEVRVDRMTEKYNVSLVGIVEVSARPDGRYAVLDGQHRVAVVRNVTFGQPSPAHVPCRVHSGLTVTEEAEVYHQLNTTRRQLTGWDRWVARRASRDQGVLAIERCAERNGLTIGTSEGSNILRSTVACERLVELGGLPLLDATLGLVLQIWPNDQTGLDGAVLRGLGHVLHTYGQDLDLARLLDTLSAVVPRQLSARAKAAREVHNGTTDRLMSHVIVELYNGPRGGRIEPFLQRVRPQTKTQTAKALKAAAERKHILAWAKATNQPGRHNRLTEALKQAYAAAHNEEQSA